jgi:hypothetical protein
MSTKRLEESEAETSGERLEDCEYMVGSDGFSSRLADRLPKTTATIGRAAERVRHRQLVQLRRLKGIDRGPVVRLIV